MAQESMAWGTSFFMVVDCVPSRRRKPPATPPSAPPLRVRDAPPSMQDKLTLMIPGPTPVPETVLQALGRHPIGHRSADFQDREAHH